MARPPTPPVYSPSTRYPEERRLATVLFADVQGFTTLAENLDFEDVSDLIKEVWERVDAVLESYGGYIDKHIGDAVMAVWGAPHAREDDAERAVRAALALQDALTDYAAHSARSEASTLKMRVGINTGAVLASYVGLRNEYTVMGDAVNTASRLETTAEPGTVVMSESTYHLVRGIFKLSNLPPLHVKGKTQFIQAFLVEGVLPQPNRIRYHKGAGGLETHMVGREVEMARLHELYRRSRSSQYPVLAFVRGEAGLGKSRLLLEFTSQLEVAEPGLSFFSARALEQMSRVPFFIWKSLWQSRFGWSDNDSPEVIRQKFLKGIQTLWGEQAETALAVEATHLIGSLIDIEWRHSPFLKAVADQPEVRLARAFELTLQLFQRIAQTGPTVLVFDDLHWADAGSISLLSYILEAETVQLPMLVLSGVRPGLLRKYHNITRLAEMINLAPLPIYPDLVAEAYPVLRTLKREVWVALAQRAEGNPYFLEEMVRNLVRAKKQGQLSDEALAAQLSESLPDSLHALLQARLDALSPEARQAILLASVVGRVFWVGAVTAAARQTKATGILSQPAQSIESTITQGLAELVKAELAFPRTDSLFAGEPEYIFKQSWVRDVAYELIPHKHRRQHHWTVARWFATHAGPDFMGTVAEHYEQAGAYPDAVKQYEQAAEYARAHGAPEDAEWLETRAGELRGKPPGSGLLLTRN